MNTPLSPKVAAAIFAGILASAVLSSLQYITPDLFHFLGGWGPFGYCLVTTAAAGTAGWVAQDLLRTLGAEALAKQTAAGPVASPYGAPELPTFPARPVTASVLPPVTVAPAPAPAPADTSAAAAAPGPDAPTP